MKQSGIYVIKNLTTNMGYVGSAINLENRWYRHTRSLKQNEHHCQRLQRAWNKYGANAFSFVMVEEIYDKTKLIEKEQIWLDQYLSSNRAYNSSPVAGSQLGFKHTQKTKKLMSLIQKRIAPYRQPFSVEAKCKFSKCKTGKENPAFKGDAVGYNALRSWIRRRKPKTQCETCGQTKNLDLVSEHQSRNPNDWCWLCRRCHMNQDGRTAFLKELANEQRLPDLTCQWCHVKVYKKDSRMKFCSRKCFGMSRRKK